MAEINEARNEMRVECPMCPWVLISLASLTCAGMSGYRGGWKTSVGRGRCKGSGEKGAHEQTMMRSGWTRGRREVVLDAVMCSESLRCDAPWSRGWRADGGNERDDDVDDRRGMCLWRVWRPEDAARSMVRMMSDDGVDYDDGSDGTVSRPEVRSKVNGDDGRLAAVSRASRRCKTQCSWQWIAEQIELRWSYLCCSVSQGFDVITPESSVRWEEDSGPG